MLHKLDLISPGKGDRIDLELNQIKADLVYKLFICGPSVGERPQLSEKIQYYLLKIIGFDAGPGARDKPLYDL